MHSTREETAAQIRASGLRATASRIAIYRAVCEIDGGHPNVGQVVERVRADTGSASMQAVYDGLQALDVGRDAAADRAGR